jgi:MSHA pilin protein MshD
MSALRGKLATGHWQLARTEWKFEASFASGCLRSGRLPVASSQLATRRARGVTLVELVISIVIISIAVTAILGVLSMLAKSSADAMIRNQAVAIATAYLEEVRMKNYVSDGVEASRSLFDDVSDYNGLSDAGAHDQLGAAITGLNNYTVTVTVGPGTVASIASTCIKRIDVRVQHTSGLDVRLSGYRADYADLAC